MNSTKIDFFENPPLEDSAKPQKNTPRAIASELKKQLPHVEKGLKRPNLRFSSHSSPSNQYFLKFENYVKILRKFEVKRILDQRKFDNWWHYLTYLADKWANPEQLGLKPLSLFEGTLNLS